MLLIKGTVLISGLQIHLPVNYSVYAQQQSDRAAEDTAPVVEVNNEESVLRMVMTVILIIWSGIALYLFRIDRKLSRIERELRSEHR